MIHVLGSRGRLADVTEEVRDEPMPGAVESRGRSG